jgi:hypothetical protein
MDVQHGKIEREHFRVYCIAQETRENDPAAANKGDNEAVRGRSGKRQT